MKIELLLKRLEALERRVGKLEYQNTLLKSVNKYLKEENTSSKGRLSDYQNLKNSRNSSIPPNKDENRFMRNQSLRQASRKKPGGQHPKARLWKWSSTLSRLLI